MESFALMWCKNGKWRIGPSWLWTVLLKKNGFPQHALSHCLSSLVTLHQGHRLPLCYPLLFCSPPLSFTEAFLACSAFKIKLLYSVCDCSCVQFGSVILFFLLELGHLESLPHPLRSVTLLTSSCTSLSFPPVMQPEREQENLIIVTCFCSSAHCRFLLNWPHTLPCMHR